MTARLVVFGGQGQLPAPGVQREAGLESRIGFFAPAGHRKRPAQGEERGFRLRVEAGGVLQNLDGFGRPAGLHQQIAEVLVGLCERGRQLDGAAQVGFRIGVFPRLQQNGAEQGRHVDVVRVTLQGIAACAGRGIHPAGVDQAYCPVEGRPGSELVAGLDGTPILLPAGTSTRLVLFVPSSQELKLATNPGRFSL